MADVVDNIRAQGNAGRTVVGAQRTAVVALVFCAVVLLLLAANAVRSRAHDPLNAPRLEGLLHDLNRSPADEALKARVRRLDRELRAEYLRSQAFALNGFYLLLGGVGVLLASLEVARAACPERPAPNPEAPREVFAAAATRRRAVIGLGVTAGGLLLLLSVLSRHDAAAEYARAALRPPEEPPPAVAGPGANPGMSGPMVVGSSLGLAGAPQAGGSAQGFSPTANGVGAPIAGPVGTGSLAPPADTTNLAPLPTVATAVATVAPPLVAPVRATAALPFAKSSGPSVKRSAGSSAAVTPVMLRAWAANWPQFRGPAGVGVAPTSSPSPISWDGATGKSILWKVKLPLSGMNSPVIWQDRVFLSGADKTSREVYCLNAKTGALLWRRPVPMEPGASALHISPDAGYAPSTLATDGARVCAIFVDGDVVCFDFAGKLLWTRKLGLPDNEYGNASSLVLYGSGLLVQMDQGTDAQGGKSTLFALDIKTGNSVWEVKRPAPSSWSTPIVVRVGRQDQVITCANPLVIAYDAQTGKELWRAECLGDEVTPSPAFGCGLVFAANLGAGLAAIRPDGAGDVTKSGIVWSYSEGLPDIASPLSAGDLLFLAASDGLVTCLDGKTGKKVWAHNFGAPFHASPILVGRTVYLTDRKGVTHLFDAGRVFREIGKAGIGEAVSATPAATPGRLYLRGKDHLFCIGPGR